MHIANCEKLEDAGAVTEIITVAYNAGYSDAETQNSRLAELEKLLWMDTTRRENFRTGLLIQ